MRRIRMRLLVACMGFSFLLAAGAMGCGSEETGDDGAGGDGAETDGGAAGGDGSSDQRTFLPEGELAYPDCDQSRRPIVFVHGTYGQGDTFRTPGELFVTNGYCVEWINGFDYDSLSGSLGIDVSSTIVQDLDVFVDGVLQRTGAEKVELIGHSQGTFHSISYLTGDPARAAKVAHYANIGGAPTDNAGGVPTLLIGSEADMIAGAPIPLGDATAVTLPGQDHYAVAATKESFQAMYEFFNDGEQPEKLEVEVREPVWVSGYAMYFGENIPITAGYSDLYEVDDDGRRLNDEAVFSLEPDSVTGAWGPIRYKPNQRYEVFGEDGTGTMGHIYYEPFRISTNLVYVKSVPAAGATALVLHQAPTDDAMEIVVMRLGGAMLAGEDSLTVNGQEVLTEDTANAANTTVAIFIRDENNNQQSDLTPIPGVLASLPFIAGIDLYVPAGGGDTVEISLNGNSYKVPTWKAVSEGVTMLYYN